MERFFRDRHDAGRVLAGKLKKYEGKKNMVVFGLARGGVVVAYEVARSLGLPLDVFIVKKIGFPGNPELAMGAIAEGGSCVVNQDILRETGLPSHELERAIRREMAELDRRKELYRREEPADVKGKTAVVVDDGLATGATMKAAIAELKKRGAAKIVAAVPVGASDTCDEIERLADELVTAVRPETFGAVGAWYEDFESTSDAEVAELLREGRRAQSAALTQFFKSPRG